MFQFVISQFFAEEIAIAIAINIFLKVLDRANHSVEIMIVKCCHLANTAEPCSSRDAVIKNICA